jgi:hypothetical protein
MMFRLVTWGAARSAAPSSRRGRRDAGFDGGAALPDAFRACPAHHRVDREDRP